VDSPVTTPSGPILTPRGWKRAFERDEVAAHLAQGRHRGRPSSTHSVAGKLSSCARSATSAWVEEGCQFNAS